MVDSVNNIQQYNYSTVANVKLNNAKNATSFSASTVSNPISSLPFNSSNRVLNKRTTLASSEEKQKYTELLKMVDKNTKKQLELLLKSGILLNSESNDHSTVLDNLYKMATTPRAEGLSQEGILKDTIATISYPFVITQQFGDIPQSYRQRALAANTDGETNLVKRFKEGQDIDVEHSGTCVAASIEFNLAQKMPAEFARFAEGLTSPNISVKKKINLNNLTDNPLDAVWLLNTFEIPYETNNFDNALLTFAPDKNAIIRAQIQTTDRDPLERSPIDVLMQSTFMQIGSQQSYSSITDKRTGKFNNNDKGLNEFEKTFTESVVEDKNKISVIYQKLDENERLIGYETDPDTMKRQLLTALNMGENIIIGYTEVDMNNTIINGHEITIVGYKRNPDGKISFICNDTDDDISTPIIYSEDYLLPKIHHAALPAELVENDLVYTPNWVEGLNLYQKMKRDIK